MKTKNILLIAMLLCLLAAPAFAHVYVPDYTDKYNPNAADGPISPATGTGILKGQLRAGGAVLDGGLDFLIINKEFPNAAPYKARFLPDGTFFDYFAPGNYTIILPQGTTSQVPDNLHPEQTEVTIRLGEVTYFSFFGSAYGTRGNPRPATISAYLGEGDIRITSMRLVQTGQHWVEPYDQTVCEQVTITDSPAWDETVIDVPAHIEYRVRGQWEWHHGHYEWHHESSWSSWSDNPEDRWSDIPNGDKQTRSVDAVTHIVHHEVVTHQETQCHQVTHPGYMQPEYGIEFFMEINHDHIRIDNPNNEPVNVAFSFDLHYWIDRRPWDHNAQPGQIESRVKAYADQIQKAGPGISTYHGMLVPDIDGAVAVVDWNQFGIQYFPYISNVQVTGTTWG